LVPGPSGVSGTAAVRKLLPGGSWDWAVSADAPIGAVDIAKGIATDCYGNVYVTGQFFGTLTLGSFTLDTSPETGQFTFIAKYDINKNVVWAKQVNTTGDINGGVKLVVDNINNYLYVTGYFRNNATFGAITLTPISTTTDLIYVTQMDPTNGNFNWAINSDTNNINSSTYVYGITVDTNGNIFITGNFYLETEFGAFILTSDSNYVDAFVVKINSSGIYQWAIQSFNNNDPNTFDDDDEIDANDIVTDSENNIYIVGGIWGICTFGNFIVRQIGTYALFVAKIDTDGSWLWVAQANSDINSSGSFGISIDCDCVNNIYVTANFGGLTTIGTHTLTPIGNSETFIGQIDKNGNWGWVTQTSCIGPTSHIFTQAISVDAKSDIYITGNFRNQVKFGNLTLDEVNGFENIFVAKMDRSGIWIWVNQCGNSNAYDEGYDIIADSQGNVFIAGYIIGQSTFGAITLTPSPNDGSTQNILIAQLIDDPDINLIGVASEDALITDTITPFIGAFATSNIFTNLIPSFDYGVNSNGELVPICKPNKYQYPEIKYIGTAVSPTQLLLNSDALDYNLTYPGENNVECLCGCVDQIRFILQQLVNGDTIEVSTNAISINQPLSGTFIGVTGSIYPNSNSILIINDGTNDIYINMCEIFTINITNTGSTIRYLPVPDPEPMCCESNCESSMRQVLTGAEGIPIGIRMINGDEYSGSSDDGNVYTSLHYGVVVYEGFTKGFLIISLCKIDDILYNGTIPTPNAAANKYFNANLLPLTPYGLNIGQPNNNIWENAYIGNMRLGYSVGTIIEPAKLSIVGQDSITSAGPNINTYAYPNDDYALYHIQSFSHDNISVAYDAYGDGTNWRSSHNGSNYVIQKSNNNLSFSTGSNTAQGSVVTMTTRAQLGVTGFNYIQMNSNGTTGSTGYFQFNNPNTFNMKIYAETPSANRSYFIPYEGQTGNTGTTKFVTDVTMGSTGTSSGAIAKRFDLKIHKNNERVNAILFMNDTAGAMSANTITLTGIVPTGYRPLATEIFPGAAVLGTTGTVGISANVDTAGTIVISRQVPSAATYLIPGNFVNLTTLNSLRINIGWFLV